MILKYINLGGSKEIQFSKQTGLLFPTTGNKLQQKQNNLPSKGKSQRMF